MALLEAVVALTVLSLTASSAAWMATEVLAASRHLGVSDEEMRGATNLLTAVSLWPNADLDRHLGKSRQGLFALFVQRQGDLYRVDVVDESGGRIVATTKFYRPDPRP